MGLLTCLGHRLLGFYNSRVVFETIVFNDPIEAMLWRQTVAVNSAIPGVLSLPDLGTHLSLSLPGSLVTVQTCRLPGWLRSHEGII